MKSRKYRCILSDGAKDKQLMASWTFEFYHQKHGWARLRNYDMRAAIKTMAIVHGLDRFEVEWKELADKQTELF